MKFGDKVYHVANPDVEGVITTPSNAIRKDQHVNVFFDKPVGFSGNLPRGKECFWTCTAGLLHSSPDHARLHDNPKRACECGSEAAGSNFHSEWCPKK